MLSPSIEGLFFLLLLFQKAMYLRELKPIMMEKLLADYLHGVDIYLNVVRKQADHAVKYVGPIAVVFAYFL